MKAKALLIVIIALACQMQLTGLMAKDTATRPASEIAINPVFLAAGTLSTEFETLVKPHWSVGANLWYEYSDVEARFAYLKLLYHPYHTNLRVFGIGADRTPENGTSIKWLFSNANAPSGQVNTCSIQLQT
ncbi:hypothetical protein MASR1M36_23170 [Candidatus Cloacimonadaceae bacterium]